ncbi:phasin family protein [Tardiphaga sp. vice352]|nr:phasin family protein [Tardiphaga sp. vice278]QDM24362.1 phasin family protein [Tardiphaga sp. vice154]QDM29562.1 phasin family protein [Tardiphaga sp. vice304]QDM34667.1 phasin family protein [Tardiphaga sp. vice352]
MGFPMTDFTSVQKNFAAIATAHSDYAKSSMEAGKTYFEKLATLKSPQTFMEATSEYTKSAYENFVSEATKIGDLYKEAFKPVAPKS